MTTKKKPTAEAVTKPETDNDWYALVSTNPVFQAAITFQQWQDPKINFMAYYDALVTQRDKVNNGDMKRPEAMLLSQAHTLDVLFNELARKAHIQTHMPHYESFLRLALKAQTQCRATLETLATIKNPPVIFAKQANISNGHQQINNGVPAPAPHAGDIKNQPNELLEVQDGSTTMDTRTTGAAIGKDKAMAAME